MHATKNVGLGDGVKDLLKITLEAEGLKGAAVERLYKRTAMVEVRREANLVAPGESSGEEA